MSTRLIRGASALALSACILSSLIPGVHAADKQRGVSSSEIVVGTVGDLSGVTAVQGVNNADAIRMVFDEVNAKRRHPRP